MGHFDLKKKKQRNASYLSIFPSDYLQQRSNDNCNNCFRMELCMSAEKEKKKKNEAPSKKNRKMRKKETE